MKRKKKSDRLTTAILILVFIAGLSLLLYPTFSEQWNAMHHSQVIDGYRNSVSTMDGDRYSELWTKAMEYNKKLLGRENGYSLPDELAQEYAECLNVFENGVMGYLEIPTISCTLAVYHGIDEAVLQTNVGHIEWSSLPVGGESSHCVLSGHRGLPSAELLTNIDRLEIGDIFHLHVLDEKLSYVVDDISVVLPEETEKLRIFEGKDYVTLLTCTPYGINSHRLLVRGVRVNANNADDEAELYIPNEVTEMDKALPVAASALLLAAAAYLVYLVLCFVKKLRPVKGRVNEDENKKID